MLGSVKLHPDGSSAPLGVSGVSAASRQNVVNEVTDTPAAPVSPVSPFPPFGPVIRTGLESSVCPSPYVTVTLSHVYWPST